MSGSGEGYFHDVRGGLLGVAILAIDVTREVGQNEKSSSTTLKELRRIGQVRMVWEELVSLCAKDSGHRMCRIKVQGTSFLNTDELIFLDDAMVVCMLEAFEDANSPLKGFSVDRFLPANRVKALIPCWRIAGLLSLLVDCCANVQHINRFLPYSDFERIDLGNNNIIDLTPDYMTRVFSSKRKWVMVKEIFDFLDHRIPHSEFIFQPSENDLTLTFKPRGCKLNLSNFPQLVEALKHVTEALVVLYELSFVHPGLKLFTGSNVKCDVGFSKLDKLLKNVDVMEEGDYDDITYCCLSAPPDHPSSVLRLTKTNKLSFVYYSLGSDSSFSNTCRKKGLRWSEVTCAKKVKSITRFHDCYLYSLTSCNGRFHAYRKESESNSFPLLVEIKMMVKYGIRKNFRQVVITFSRILEFDCLTLIDSYSALSLLKGSSIELFTIVIGVKDETSVTVGVAKFFKLNVHNKAWEEMDDHKETIIFVELSTNVTPLFATHTIASSEPRGYIYILCDTGNIVYSYHLKDQTVSVSSIPHVAGINDGSSWTMLECTSLEHDHAHLNQEKDKRDEIVVSSVNYKTRHSDIIPASVV